MRVRKSLIALSAACLIAGCSTAYQPDGFSGGYSDKMLANNTVLVSFRVNRLTTTDTLHSYLLRRCAEVTLQDGFNYFVLVHEEDPTEATTDSLGSKVSSATIQMYQARAQAGAQSYDASFLLRQILAREGESEEPPPLPVMASAGNALPPPIPGSATASASTSSRWPSANPNPNALTNEPLHMDNW